MDFDPILQSAVERFRPIPFAEFLPPKSRASRIQGLIPMTGLGVIYGPFSSGKSFFTLDLCFAMAAGFDWQGRPTRRSKVVYVVAEGLENFQDRCEAYARHHELDRDEVDISFVSSPPNLLSDDAWSLGQAIELSGGADVIVFDTLSQCMPGGDENNSVAMTQIAYRANELCRAFSAFVLVVAHAGKDGSKGVRGHTSLPAAADLMIQTKEVAKGQRFEAEVTKRKSGRCGERFAFSLLDVECGIDSDGEPLSAAVCIHETPHSTTRAAKWGKWQSAVIEAITVEGDMHLESLILYLKDKYPHTNGKEDKRRDSIQRAVNSLVSANFVEVKDGYVCFAQPTA